MQKLVVVFAVGCASTASHPAEPVTAPRPIPNPNLTIEPIVEVVAPVAVALPDDDTTAPTAAVHTVQFTRSSVLVKEPHADAERVGVIRKGARAVVVATAPGDDGCAARWLEIEPRGWACETEVEPTTAPPTTAQTYSLSDEPDEDDRAVRGLYGTVRGKNVQAFDSAEDAKTGANGRVLVGSNSVRAAGIVTIAGKRYWRTSRGDLIDASSIRRFSPSKFRGVALANGEPPPAWVRARRDPKEPAKTRATPSPRGKVVRELDPRTVVQIVAESDDARFVQLDDDSWIARDDLRVASLTEPPPGTGADERWFDVDLDEQVLVAYEGTRAVYATLVSTGKYGHRTPTKITRVKAKLERATMASDDNEVYSVADVPWTMYYDDKGYALHTSYWHNGFGGTRSHGCINLAPHDARVLYHWSSPDVPPGWTAVYGDEDNPGSLVRVRSRRVPDPEFKGYARRLIASR